MNDLTISRSSLLDKQRKTAPISPFLSIDAGELSFRKIQASAEPILAKLRNAGMIQEINYIFHEVGQGAQLFSEKAGATIFFGSVFIDVQPTEAGIIYGIDVATFDRVSTNDGSKLAHFNVARRREVFEFSADPGKPQGGCAAVRNALITGAYQSKASGGMTTTIIGMMIRLKPTCSWKLEYSDPEDLGRWEMENFIDLYDSRNESNRSMANYWDGSSAATGLPGYLKPRKLTHRVSNLSLYLSADSNVTAMIPGIILPKNYVGYLQYVRAKLNGGTQLQPDDVPVEDRAGIDALLSDILEGISAGAIELGSDPCRFVVPAFDFNEIVQTGRVEGGYITTSAFIFGFDHGGAETLSLNRIQTYRAIVGNSDKVVALCYPIKSQSDTNFERFPIAHDLVELYIKKLVTSLPFNPVTSEYDGAPGVRLDAQDDHRHLSQYSFSFKYPDPILV